MINLTAHEPGSPLPCLCKTCFASAPAEASTEGLAFRRVTVSANFRELHAWLPSSLEAEAPLLLKSMAQRLSTRTRSRYAEWVRPRREPLVPPRAKPKTEKVGLWGRVRKLFT